MLKWHMLAALVLVSCTNAPNKRSLASSADQQELEKLYATEVDKDFLKYQVRELKEKLESKERLSNHESSNLELDAMRFDIAKLDRQIESLEQQTNKIRNDLQSRFRFSEPHSEEVWFDKAWRQHHDEVILHNLEEFPLYNGKPVRKVLLSTGTAHTVILQMTNFTLSWDLKKLTFRNQLPEDREYDSLSSEVSCNRNIKLHTWPRVISVPAWKRQEFSWYDAKLNGVSRPSLEILNPDTQCIVKFGKNRTMLNYGFTVESEEPSLAKLTSPEKKGEVCFLPKTSEQKGTAQFFLSTQHTQTTCPIKIDNYKTLEESTEGLNAKVRLLTGKDLTPEYIKKGDPFAALDFSLAPKLDAVLISYLVFRADFSGQVLMQALRYHADRGAFIRIALSDVISLGKDRQMLFDLQAKYPNVKLLFYKYRSEGKGFKDWFSTFHRTNHIKFLLTYSESQDSANAVILGGRNIHDGFIFDQPVSNYINDNMVRYGNKGDEAWARWEDFETIFFSRTLVNRFMEHYFATLHADYSRFYIRPFTVVIEMPEELKPGYLNLSDNEIYLRSLMSVPFKDEMLLEKTYVRLFDSAQNSIKISTPYFNITDKMLAAIERAVDRGVKIELITRLDLKGDTADIVLSDVNKKSINKIYKKINVYEYTTQGKILHSKLIVVDDDFVLMGSVNMNLRSFFHDMENSTMVYGKGFNRRILNLYEQYKKESRLLTEKQKTTWWKAIIIKVLGTAL